MKIFWLLECATSLALFSMKSIWLEPERVKNKHVIGLQNWVVNDLNADFHITFGNLIMLLKMKQNHINSISTYCNIFSNYDPIFDWINHDQIIIGVFVVLVVLFVWSFCTHNLCAIFLVCRNQIDCYVPLQLFYFQFWLRIFMNKFNGKSTTLCYHKNTIRLVK